MAVPLVVAGIGASVAVAADASRLVVKTIVNVARMSAVDVQQASAVVRRTSLLNLRKVSARPLGRVDPAVLSLRRVRQRFSAFYF